MRFIDLVYSHYLYFNTCFILAPTTRMQATTPPSEVAFQPARLVAWSAPSVAARRRFIRAARHFRVLALRAVCRRALRVTQPRRRARPSPLRNWNDNHPAAAAPRAKRFTGERYARSIPSRTSGPSGQGGPDRASPDPQTQRRPRRPARPDRTDRGRASGQAATRPRSHSWPRKC